MAASTKYMKITTTYVIASDNAHSNVLEEYSHTEEYTGDKFSLVRGLEVATGGDTVELGLYTTIQDALVVNKDASNYVDTTHRTAPGSTTDQNARVDAGKAVKLGDVTPGSDLVLTANGAACECDILVIGSN